MVDFSGWEMPLEYPATGGLIAEHKAVRTAAGVFDVSHMGDVRVHGPQALAAVQYLTMNDVARIAPRQCQYSAMLYPAGTFVDDLVVHKLAEDDYWIVINAGTREKDWQWVCQHVGSFDCVPEHLSDHFTQIAIQGPKSIDILHKLTDTDLSRVKFYWFTRGTVCGLKNVMIARTGYTAEDGFELYLPADERANERVWDELLDAGRAFGCLPCGLGARNTLRLEGCLPLYGHEISDQITVWEAGLDRFCRMEKPEFVGKAALERQKAEGITRRLIGLEIEGGIARDGYRVVDQTGREIGHVTSGSYAPFLKKSIALAYAPPECSATETLLGVEVRKRVLRARVVATPFYTRPRKATP
jgi:aminomethyltransferase